MRGTVRHNGGVYRVRVRVADLFEADAKVWGTVLLVTFAVGFAVWPLAVALAGPAGDAAGIVGAILAAVVAVGSGALAGFGVSLVDSSDKPFPQYHLAKWWDEAGTPREDLTEYTTVAAPVPDGFVGATEFTVLDTAHPERPVQDVVTSTVHPDRPERDHESADAPDGAVDAAPTRVVEAARAPRIPRSTHERNTDGPEWVA